MGAGLFSEGIELMMHYLHYFPLSEQLLKPTCCWLTRQTSPARFAFSTLISARAGVGNTHQARLTLLSVTGAHASSMTGARRRRNQTKTLFESIRHRYSTTNRAERRINELRPPSPTIRVSLFARSRSRACYWRQKDCPSQERLLYGAPI